jgi:hypothetical protein
LFDFAMIGQRYEELERATDSTVQCIVEWSSELASATIN